MEIIKRGKAPEEKIWRGECTQCRSIIRAKRSELEIEHDFREGNDFGRSLCPVCNASMIFYEK